MECKGIKNLVTFTQDKMRKIEVKSPEMYFKKLKNWISKPENKIPIFTTIIVGIIVHFQLYSQEITNPDGLWNSVYHISGTWEVSLGRWGIVFFDYIRGGLVSPIISTFISIIIMASVSLVIVKIFEMKNKLVIFLTSVIIISMPTISEILTYWYCSDSYTFSILMSVLSVYFLYCRPYEKRFKNIFLSSICLAISMSLYQSQLGTTVGLIAIMIIRDILKNKKQANQILNEILNSLIMGILGAIIYYVVTQIALKIYGIALSEYSGASSVGLKSLKSLKISISNTYINFIQYYLKNDILYNEYWGREKLNIILIIVTIISSLFFIIRNKIYRDKVKSVILIIFVLILPICLAAIEIVAPERTITLLMAFSYVIPIIFCISIIEILPIKEHKNILNLTKYVIYIIVFIIIRTYILSDNANYMAIKNSNLQTYSYAIRVMDRIETNEEYRKNMPVMFAGVINKEGYPRSSKIYEMANGFTSKFDVLWNSYSGSKGTWGKFLNRYLGTTVKWCTREEYTIIAMSEEFKNMKVFPDKDSIKVINGVMVVKFTNDPPMP